MQGLDPAGGLSVKNKKEFVCSKWNNQEMVPNRGRLGYRNMVAAQGGRV